MERSRHDGNRAVIQRDRSDAAPGEAPVGIDLDSLGAVEPLRAARFRACLRLLRNRSTPLSGWNPSPWEFGYMAEAWGCDRG